MVFPVSDTASALAAAPKTGMRRIPFPLESYQHNSPALQHKRLVNLMAEAEPADSRTAAALVPTPGMDDTGERLGGGPINAMNCDIAGVLYAVSGGSFFRRSVSVGGTLTITDLGFVGFPSLPDYPQHILSTIACGPTACVVCVPPNAFTCAHDGPLNQIGGDFSGARSVTYLDGYFVYTAEDGRFFASRLFDPLDYDALDFAYADADSDIVRRVMSLGGLLWFIGDRSVEIWYDAGSSGLETTPGISFFPFRRQSGGVIQHGTLSAKTCAIADGSLFWVTADWMVMRSVGMKAKRISTHAIEDLLRFIPLTDINNAWAYSQNGHTFYVLDLTSRTLVYDCATQVWHERASSVDVTGGWRCTGPQLSSINQIFAERTTGRLALLNPEVGQEFGTEVARQYITPPLWADTNRAFCSRLELEMEINEAPVTLEWSDDAGITWSAPRVLTRSGATRRTQRMVTTRLGSFRERMFRVTTVSRATFYALSADITAGVGG
jgi:hypothetical protein